MKIRGLRWWIVLLVFLAAVLNYVDRQALPALAPTIQADLGIDDREYADVLNLFLLAYMVAYLVSGKLIDRFGTRAGMAFFVVWWSLANIATAWSQGLRSMAWCRLMLGLGEAGIWPAASKVVSEWFPARERALAIGLYTLGATAGAALAPYIVIPLATHGLPWAASWFGQGWRLAFLITGLAGVVWVIPWLWLYRRPAESKRLTPGELSLITQGDDAGPPGKAWSLKQLLAFRPLWLLLAGRLITDPVWFFYQFWIAKYLSSERGLDQKALTITWVIFAAAGIGSLAGGWFSGLLIRKGMPVVSARLRAMLCCACMMPVVAFTAQAGDLASVMAISAITVFAATAWLTNISTMVVDSMPRHSLGTAFSLIGAGSTFGGIAMNMMVVVMVASPQAKAGGFLDQGFRAALGPLLGVVEGGGYGAWFMVMAFLHPLAFLLLWWGGIRRIGGQPEK